MIILEGMDLLGKTTLAKKLVEVLRSKGYPMQYAHMSKPPEGFDFYWGYERLIHPHVVQDRFHLGEIAYGSTIYGCRQTVEQMRMVEASIIQAGGIVCLFTATQDWIDSARGRLEAVVRQEGRSEMFRLEQIAHVNRFYRDQLRHKWNPIIDFGYTFMEERPGKWLSEDTFVLNEITSKWEKRQQLVADIQERAKKWTGTDTFKS